MDMAVNSLSSVQAANLRESRANSVEQRGQQTRQAQRAEQGERAERSGAEVKKRVGQNADAGRTRAQANDEAATQQRREAQAADKKADTERRQTEKSTIGSRINTTA
jgi:hypothetical protein